MLLLDPNWKVSPASILNRDQVQSFVQHCISKLIRQSAPSIVTLKMQLYFEFNINEAKQVVTRSRQDVRSRVLPLEREIVGATSDESDHLIFKRIVYLATLNSGLGNPTLQPVKGTQTNLMQIKLAHFRFTRKQNWH